MADLLQPKPSTYQYQYLLTSIENGHFKIPLFQREFVWSKDKSAKLLDSILRGYPIGTFILWRTQDRLAHVKNIGNADIPDTPEGYPVQYILDGQQRLASLFVTIKGLLVNKTDYKEIYINLEDAEEDELISLTESNKSITIYELLNEDIKTLIDKYPAYINKISEFQN